MNSLISTPPPAFPHQLHNSSRRSPPLSLFPLPAMSGKKRKHDDDPIEYSRSDSQETGQDDRMSASPSNSPALHTRTIAHANKSTNKRFRSNACGRPLTLPRLLETLDADSLRNVLSSLCHQHPELGSDVVSLAPRPSVESAMRVLTEYESTFRSSFPIGSTTSDYAYHRVKNALKNLLNALSDFTPQFLPPHETQTATSLQFLENATDFIHRLPDWDNPANQHHKNFAYEEISKAWALTIKEASKRAGGIQLHNGGWEHKLAKHNQVSGSRMQGAVNELAANLQWMGAGDASQSAMSNDDHRSIRQELLSGRYGAGMSVSVGPW